MRSWQTTSYGTCVILIGLLSALKLLLDGDPATNPDWNLVAVAFFSGIGHIRARDNSKSDEQVGAR